MTQLLIIAVFCWLVIGLAMMPDAYKTTKLLTIFAIAVMIAVLTYWGRE